MMNCGKPKSIGLRLAIFLMPLSFFCINMKTTGITILNLHPYITVRHTKRISPLYDDLKRDVAELKSGEADEVLNELIKRQTEGGFGFSRYWIQGYTIGEAYNDYYANSGDEKKTQFRGIFPQDADAETMTEEKKIENFTVYKIIWRQLRKFGFPGVINKTGCFLCLDNIPDKQKGVILSGEDVEYVALVQPFPILKDHVTIAIKGSNENHIKQDEFKSEKKYLKFLLDLTEKSSEFKFFFNDAGASIPLHLHFQGFRDTLPIETAHLQTIVENTAEGVKISMIKEWPIITFVFEGQEDKLADLVFKAVQRADKVGIPFNILTSRKKNGDLKIYFIPRSSDNPSDSVFNHNFGTVEMCGFIVAENSNEFGAIKDKEQISNALKKTGYAYDKLEQLREDLRI